MITVWCMGVLDERTDNFTNFRNYDLLYMATLSRRQCRCVAGQAIIFQSHSVSYHCAVHVNGTDIYICCHWVDVLSCHDFAGPQPRVFKGKCNRPYHSKVYRVRNKHVVVFALKCFLWDGCLEYIQTSIQMFPT